MEGLYLKRQRNSILAFDKNGDMIGECMTNPLIPESWILASDHDSDDDDKNDKLRSTLANMARKLKGVG